MDTSTEDVGSHSQQNLTKSSYNIGSLKEEKDEQDPNDGSFINSRVFGKFERVVYKRDREGERLNFVSTSKKMLARELDITVDISQHYADGSDVEFRPSKLRNKVLYKYGTGEINLLVTNMVGERLGDEFGNWHVLTLFGSISVNRNEVMQQIRREKYDNIVFLYTLGQLVDSDNTLTLLLSRLMKNIKPESRVLFLDAVPDYLDRQSKFRTLSVSQKIGQYPLYLMELGSTRLYHDYHIPTENFWRICDKLQLPVCFGQTFYDHIAALYSVRAIEIRLGETELPKFKWRRAFLPQQTHGQKKKLTMEIDEVLRKKSFYNYPLKLEKTLQVDPGKLCFYENVKDEPYAVKEIDGLFVAVGLWTFKRYQFIPENPINAVWHKWIIVRWRDGLLYAEDIIKFGPFTRRHRALYKHRQKNHYEMAKLHFTDGVDPAIFKETVDYSFVRLDSGFGAVNWTLSSDPWSFIQEEKRIKIYDSKGKLMDYNCPLGPIIRTVDSRLVVMATYLEVKAYCASRAKFTSKIIVRPFSVSDIAELCEDYPNPFVVAEDGNYDKTLNQLRLRHLMNKLNDSPQWRMNSMIRRSERLMKRLKIQNFDQFYQICVKIMDQNVKKRPYQKCQTPCDHFKCYE